MLIFVSFIDTAAKRGGDGFKIQNVQMGSVMRAGLESQPRHACLARVETLFESFGETQSS
jgi:hypothetical protein